MVASVFQGLLNDQGRIRTGSGPVVSYFRGLPFNAEGNIVVEAGAVARYDQGIPFTASGAVAITLPPVQFYGPGASPYGSTGVLCALSGEPLEVPAFYHQGVPYHSDGSLFVGGGVVGWSPAELFGSGEAGAWYDPSDLGSMYLDPGRTSPASVDQVVGIIDPQISSPDSESLIQSTLSRRPILRQEGSLYFLEFDGVDDVLFAGPGFFPNMWSEPWEFWCAFTPVGTSLASAPSAGHGTFSRSGTDTASTTTNNTQGMFHRANLSGSVRYPQASSKYGTGATNTATLINGFSYGTPIVMCSMLDSPITNLRVRNGTASAQQFATLSGTPGAVAFRLGHRAAGLAWKFFGAVAINRKLTEDESTQLRDWLNVKAGIV